jgi:hypothetical protein
MKNTPIEETLTQLYPFPLLKELTLLKTKETRRVKAVEITIEEAETLSKREMSILVNLLTR